MKRLSNRKYKTLIAIFSSILIICCSYLVLMFWWRSTYNIDNNNCVDMSYKIAPVFHRMGFNTTVIYGYNNQSAHAWISINGIYFDATTLWFNNEKDYKVSYVDSYPYDSMKGDAANK